jgi:hypothetical protein
MSDDADTAHAYAYASKVGLPTFLTKQEREKIWLDIEAAYVAGIQYGRAHPAPPDRPLSPAEWGHQAFARPEDDRPPEGTT